ncbi:MAG: oxygen-independent coproporphyrinogen III oxidase [Burkholderiales bacterium]|nr:oxygen-independent coproporphyrinogen III oxidase [Burkholderiales bacterium]
MQATPVTTHVVPDLGEALLRRMDTPGPRYTSYPTADRFHDHWSRDAWDAVLRTRRGAREPLSLYVHVPFCESVCFYCACNKVVTRRHERSGPWLDAIEREVALVCDRMGTLQPVGQLHLGGGTPTFLSDAELARLLSILDRAFALQPDAERAVEVDPRTVDGERLARLAAMGFDRLSFGVQDFDPSVQKAVHREQSVESVAELLDAARRLGFRSTNVDLIYGLPHQTPASFERTVRQVTALAPDRVAMYGYAHLPSRFKPQRSIDEATLPQAADRLAMLQAALRLFGDAGYDYIGMDHFAKHDDRLAQAHRAGRLHRNFQGYTTRPGGDLVALGPSAISQVADHYSQNTKALPDYEAALTAGRLPVERGYALNAEDRLRRDVVMAVMCRGEIVPADIEARHGIDFARHFAPELAALGRFEDDAMLVRDADRWRVTDLGWYFVRAIAMAFDQHLRTARAAPAQFSRVV